MLTLIKVVEPSFRLWVPRSDPMDQSSLPRYRYTIDRHDVITSVCPLWLAFARENGRRTFPRRRARAIPLAIH